MKTTTSPHRHARAVALLPYLALTAGAAAVAIVALATDSAYDPVFYTGTDDGPIVVIMCLVAFVVARTTRGALRASLVTLTTLLLVIVPVARALATTETRDDPWTLENAHALEIAQLDSTITAAWGLTALILVLVPVVAILAARTAPPTQPRPRHPRTRLVMLVAVILAAGTVSLLLLLNLVPGGADVLDLWFASPLDSIAASGAGLVIVVLVLCARSVRFDGARVPAALLLATSTIHLGLGLWSAEFVLALPALHIVASIFALGAWYPFTWFDAGFDTLATAGVMLVAGTFLLLVGRHTPADAVPASPGTLLATDAPPAAEAPASLSWLQQDGPARPDA